MNLEFCPINHTLNEDDVEKSDILILILGVALVVGMILTALFGRGSKHGYGAIPDSGSHPKHVSLQDFATRCRVLDFVTIT